jgi:hypothetical protein
MIHELSVSVNGGLELIGRKVSFSQKGPLEQKAMAS